MTVTSTMNGWRCFVVTGAVMIVLAGCGGGGDSASTSAPAQASTAASDFVVIGGNANSGIILDGAGNQFAQTKYSNTLYAIASDRYLSGLTVGSGGEVYDQGRQIASIILDIASDGRKVAYLACSGPAPNLGKMTITVSGGGYTYSCASNTGQATTPSTTTPSTTTPNGGNNTPTATPNQSTPSSRIDTSAEAIQCLQRGVSSSGAITVTNTCGFVVQYSYCNTLPDPSGSSLFQCKASPENYSPTGYVYQQGASGLAAGKTNMLLGANRPGNTVFVAACRGTIGEISAHIVSVDTNRGTFSMICLR